MTTHLLASFILIPAAGAIVAAVLPPASGQGRRWVLLVVAVLELALGLVAVCSFDLSGSAATQAHLRFTASMSWAPSLGLDVQLGVDQLNVYALVVIPLLFLIAVSANFACGRGRSLGLLVALASLQGVFIATDLLLVSLFAQTAVFGFFLGMSSATDDGDSGVTVRASERQRAALRFLLFNYTATLALTAAALLVRSAAQQQTGSQQLDPEQLLTLALPGDTQAWIGLAFGLFLVIMLPLAPFHGWFVELFAIRTRRPLEMLVIVGAWPLVVIYVMLRFALPLCPEPAEMIGAEWGGALATWAALHGALVALGEHASARRRMACICLSFNGLMLLGLWSLSAEGIHGSLLYALSHSLVRSLLVALALFNTRRNPLLWWGVAIAFVGFPAAAPFSGVLLCIIGGFAAFPGHAVATLGGLCVAAYGLLSPKRNDPSEGELPVDPGLGEGVFPVTAVSILGLVLCLGVYPAPLLRITAPAVERIAGWLPTTGYSVIGAEAGGSIASPLLNVTEAALEDSSQGEEDEGSPSGETDE